MPQFDFDFLDPANFSAGNVEYPNDTPGTIVKARTATGTFGDGGKAYPCVTLDIRQEDGTLITGVEIMAGEYDNLRPSNDGVTSCEGEGIAFCPAPGKSGVKVGQSGALGIFINELKNAGFDTSAIRYNGFPALDGHKFHFLYITKAYEFTDKKPGPTLGKIVKGNKRYLTTSKYHGEGSSKAAPAAKSAAKASTPAAAPAALDETLVGYVSTVVAEAGGSLPKAKLSLAILALLKQDESITAPERSKLMTAASKDEFLKAGAAAGSWAYDGKEIAVS